MRFNVEDFPLRVQVAWRISEAGPTGYFQFPNSRVAMENITSVWCRRPVTPVPSPEIVDPAAREFSVAESQAALDGAMRSLDCYWISCPENIRRAELKVFQLKAAAEVGLALSPTLVTNNPIEARAFVKEADGQVVVKPLRRGQVTRGKTVSLIFTNPLTSRELVYLDSISLTPTLLQRYVPKRFEIRVTVIGHRAFSVAIFSQERPDSQHDWRRGDRSNLRYVRCSP